MKPLPQSILLAAGLTHHAAAARKLWTASVGDLNNIIQTAYTIGNGKQAGMSQDIESLENTSLTTKIGLPLGIPGNDFVPINHDSLWRGGPFASSVRSLPVASVVAG